MKRNDSHNEAQQSEESQNTIKDCRLQTRCYSERTCEQPVRLRLRRMAISMN